MPSALNNQLSGAGIPAADRLRPCSGCKHGEADDCWIDCNVKDGFCCVWGGSAASIHGITSACQQKWPQARVQYGNNPLALKFENWTCGTGNQEEVTERTQNGNITIRSRWSALE